MSTKVIAINGWWAGIISAVMGTAICSGFAFAFSMNNDVLALKKDVAPLMSANLTVEVPVIREQVKQIKDSTSRIESQQTKINDKLDDVLQIKRR